MDEFFWALAASAIGALTWLAYRYPKSYQRVGWIVLALNTIAVALTFAYTLGAIEAHTELIPYLDDDPQNAAEKVVEALYPSTGKLILVYLVVNVYLLLLFGLRPFLGLEEKARVPEHQPDEHRREP